MPVLSKSDEQSDVMLEAEQAEDILQYLRRFEYASREHVVMEVLWNTGMRLGALHSLDIEDYDREEQYLEIHHRPETDTPLKNGDEGERLVALTQTVCETLDDWIEHQRPDVTDEHGRNPLITSEHGRLGKTNIREAVYRATRPCYVGSECPHGRDEDDCEGTNYGHYSTCPSSVSPHAVRRGSITHHLSEDVPEKVVSDRMNVGPDVLDKHYDKRSERQKVEQRRGYLDNI
jgi:integrase